MSRGYVLAVLAATATAALTLKQTVAVPSRVDAEADSRGTELLAVINPDSGPGSLAAVDPEYVAQVSRSHDSELTMLAYVHASITEVHKDVDAYVSWYAVDGIFVDEVASGASDAPYFEALAAYIRGKAAPGGATPLVVLNPGTNLDAAYNSSFDIVMSFEDTLESYREFEPAAWLRTIAPQRVWHCIHTAGTAGNLTAPLAEAVARSKTLNAGVLYVTNETLPNPYGELPTGLYLEDLLRWAADDF